MGCVEHNQAGNKSGYGMHCHVEDGKRIQMGLHRWVFLQHNGYLPKIVMHSCNNPRCINPTHLIPGNQKLNQQQMSREGRQRQQQLCASQVLEIRRRFASGERIVDLAKAFNVGWYCIRSVVTRRSWAWLED